MHLFCMWHTELSRAELAERFNETFGTDRRKSCISNFCKRHGYLTGRCGKFKKGHKSWNKGRKGWQADGVEHSQFRAGNRPQNAVPVGTRTKTSGRHNPDGSVKEAPMWRIKTAEPNTWEFEHRLNWMEVHGPIPAGMAVVFIDGDQDNTAVENLTLMSRGELAVLNKHYKLPNASPDERQALITIAKISYASSRAMFSEADKAKAKRHGIKPGTAYARIKSGWPREIALTAPVGTRLTHTPTKGDRPSC